MPLFFLHRISLITNLQLSILTISGIVCCLHQCTMYSFYWKIECSTNIVILRDNRLQSKMQQGNHGHQTSPLVTCCPLVNHFELYLCRHRHNGHYGKRWRHPKKPEVHNVLQRHQGGLSHGHRQHAQKIWFGSDVSEICAQRADRQTADTFITGAN